MDTGVMLAGCPPGRPLGCAEMEYCTVDAARQSFTWSNFRSDVEHRS